MFSYDRKQTDVRVRFVKSSGAFNSGETAAFGERDAMRLVRSGVAVRLNKKGKPIDPMPGVVEDPTPRAIASDPELAPESPIGAPQEEPQEEPSNEDDAPPAD